MIVSSPADAGPRPAILLIPDVRGIYDHFVDVAQRFAAHGFVVATIDLYTREGAPEIADVESALRWMADLDDRRVLGDIDAYRRKLAARDDVDSDAVGITGFCMGGQYALMAACHLDGFAACVSWYGMLRHAITTERKLPDPLDSACSLSCPYLGLFGETDGLIPMEQVDQLRNIVAALPQATEIVSYANAGHAFFNDSRPAGYVADAAQDAWGRALAFFRTQLGSG